MWDRRTPRAGSRPPAVTRLACCTVKCSQCSPLPLALRVLWPRASSFTLEFSQHGLPPWHVLFSKRSVQPSSRSSCPAWLGRPGAVRAPPLCQRHQSRREEKTGWFPHPRGWARCLCLPWTPVPPWRGLEQGRGLPVRWPHGLHGNDSGPRGRAPVTLDLAKQSGTFEDKSVRWALSRGS